MEGYCLAIDFGASSACCILGHMEDNRLITEEVHRFKTGFTEKDNEKVWDIDGFFENIVTGLKRCKEIGKEPEYVAIDTWGVDFVLLDKEGRMIGNAVSYRDSRTDGIIEEAEKVLPFTHMYEHTGIQKQKFNTVYQILSLIKDRPEYIDRAECMLMLPDYYNYLLTGIKTQEYTNATTTGMVNAASGTWDTELTERLGIPSRLLLPIEAPGRILGNVTAEIADRIGYSPKVVLAASHDTASAIMSVPALTENVLYISSGTWSLMGTELKSPICSDRSREYNFTNEGGYEYRFRYLKNIMGLWMLQSVREEIAPDMSYSQMVRLAEQSTVESIVDANDGRFLAPDSMKDEIDAYIVDNSLELPVTVGDYARVIYNSLAECYKRTAEEIEEMTGIRYDSINIIGGGSNAEYLNEVTAKKTGKRVLAGPSEGTALGNILTMLIAAGRVEDLNSGRALIGRSANIRIYEP